MTFAESTAQQLRIPLGTILRAERRIVRLLCEHAAPVDLQLLHDRLPEFREHLRAAPTASKLMHMLRRRLRALPWPRGTQRQLRDVGLGESDVSFVSAFTNYLRRHLVDDEARRLIHSVPGLAAMSDWPLAPFRGPDAEQPPDPARI